MTEEQISNEQETLLKAINCLEELKDFVNPKQNLEQLGMYISINQNIINLANLVRQKALQTIEDQ